MNKGADLAFCKMRFALRGILIKNEGTASLTHARFLSHNLRTPLSADDGVSS